MLPPPVWLLQVTPSNFDEVVMAEGKDVMIEFYAPWCGHCQHLRPVYREVAEAVSRLWTFVACSWRVKGRVMCVIACTRFVRVQGRWPRDVCMFLAVQ